MKKIIYLTGVILVIPFFISIFYYTKEQVTNEEVVIKVKRVDKGKIEEINLEEYVIGVVAGEMPCSFELEALKAQAVASRTYALKRIKKNSEYDVVDTTANQVYLDDDRLKSSWGNKYDKNIEKIKKAVNNTEGQYLSYNNQYVEALFFSTSNGYTENSENVFKISYPYLKSVNSKWDEASPVFNDEEVFERNEFCKKLEISNCESINITNIEKNESGRIDSITVNDKTYTGVKIRNLLGLRSSDFSISVTDTTVTVDTQGYGHGVGMSQYGANGMAKEGYKYDEILEYYYTGVKIEKIWIKFSKL